MHPKGLPVDGPRNFSSGWMPPVYQGMAMRAEGTPVLNLAPSGPAGAANARLELLQHLNREHFETRADQLELEARIASFELGARMQIAASEALDLSREPKSCDLYGTSDPESGIRAPVAARPAIGNGRQRPPFRCCCSQPGTRTRRTNQTIESPRDRPAGRSVAHRSQAARLFATRS
jgi:hypothetical protein